MSSRMCRFMQTYFFMFRTVFCKHHPDGIYQTLPPGYPTLGFATCTGEHTALARVIAGLFGMFYLAFIPALWLGYVFLAKNKVNTYSDARFYLGLLYEGSRHTTSAYICVVIRYGLTGASAIYLTFTDNSSPVMARMCVYGIVVKFFFVAWTRYYSRR